MCGKATPFRQAQFPTGYAWAGRGHSPKIKLEIYGRPQAFRTSGGGAENLPVCDDDFGVNHFSRFIIGTNSDQLTTRTSHANRGTIFPIQNGIFIHRHINPVNSPCYFLRG